MGPLTDGTACLLCRRNDRWDEVCRVGFGAIVRCSGCGLVRTWPPRTGEELAALHATAEYFRHPYFEARRDLGRRQVVAKHRRLLSRLDAEAPLRGGRLLDVGCDTGALCAVAQREFGMKAMGIEVSAMAAESARKEHGLTVEVGDITTLSLPEGHYQLITLVDVLEHTTNPLAVLQAVRRLLAPGGRAYVLTVNHDALINHIGYSLYSMLGPLSRPILEKLYIPYHEYYLTKATLASLAGLAGLTIVRQTTDEFPLLECGYGMAYRCALAPIFLVQRLFKRESLLELIASRATG